MSSFAERLRDLRRRAGLSQADLAGTGLSPSYISRLEAGTRTPSREVLHHLATRLGCSVSQLEDGRPSEREERLALELAYARLAIEHGEGADARARLERLLEDPRLHPTVKDEATLLLGQAQHALGDPAAAAALLQPLYDKARALTTAQPLLTVVIPLCFCYYASGDLHRAATIGSEALELARQRGLDGTDDYFRLGATVMGVSCELGDFLFARTMGRQLTVEAEEAGRPAGQAALYWNAAVLAEYEGRLGEAVRLCGQAMARMGELENTRDFARLRLAVAGILMACDPPEVDQAASLLDRCRSDLQDLGSKLDLAEWSCVRSAVFLCRGDVGRAEDHARDAVELLRGQPSPGVVRAGIVLADALVAQGRQAEAVEQLAEAADRLETIGSGRVIGLLWRELAERLADVGDLDAATPCYRRALEHGGIRDRSVAMRRVALNHSRQHVSSVAGLRPPSEGPAETP